MHPLTGQLRDLSDDELHKKFSDLNSKMNTAFSLGNHAMITQLNMLIEDYRAEIQTRNEKLIEQMQNRSKKFTDVIDIQ